MTGSQQRVPAYRRAFTLIELIVVIVILGVVAAVGVASYKVVLNKTDTSTNASSLQSVIRDVDAGRTAESAKTYNATHLKAIEQDLPDVDVRTGGDAAVTAKKQLAVAVGPDGKTLGFATLTAGSCTLSRATADGPTRSKFETWQRTDLNGATPATSCSAAIAVLGPAYTGTLIVPATPTNLTGISASGQVTLSWEHPATGAAVTSTRIFRDGVEIGTVTFDTTSYVDTTVTVGQSYTYTVIARNLAGPSASSAGLSVTVTSGPPPAPVGLTATSGNGSATLGWGASANASSYRVYSGNVHIGTTTAPTTTYTASGLTNGTTYQFTVTAVNADGESAPSNVASAYPTAPLPSAPGTLNVTAGTTSANLTWGASTGDVTGYRIVRDGTVIATVGATTSYGDTGLSTATSYSYQVRAYNGSGDGPNSNTVTILTLPAAPTGMAISGSGNSATISWVRPSGTLSGFRIFRNGSLLTTLSDATATSYVDNTLASGTSYTWYVRAYNATGDSPNSSTVSYTTAPAAPTSLAASVSGTTATLTWTPPSGTVSGFKVFRNGALLATITSGTATGYTDSALSTGMSYTWHVVAYNAGGDSPNSNSASGSTVPSTPTGVSASAGNGSVTVTWTPPSGTVSGFYVYRDGSLVANVTPGTATSFTNSGLTNGVTYSFTVAAYNSAGASAQSSSVTARPNDAYGNLVASAGPIAHYRLEDAGTSSTTVADASGNGRHATRPTATTPGAATTGLRTTTSTAAQFDGTSAHLAAPAGFASFPNGFSVEAWVNFATTGQYERIIDFGNGANSDNIILYRDGSNTGLVFNILRGTGHSIIHAPNAIINGETAHFAATVDNAGNARIYKNGNVVASGVINTPNAVTRSANYIGRSNWTGDTYFNGRIDEVAVYDKVLTPTQVMNHASALLAPTAPTGFSVTGGASRNTLAWTLPVGGVQGLYVYRSGALLATVTPGNTTSWVNTGLTNGVTYPYEVAAYNPVGTGPRTAVVNGVPTSPFYVAMRNSNPAMWWKFDDAVGTNPVLDSSGNGHAGTLVNSVPSMGQTSAISTELGSFTFSGDGGYVVGGSFPRPTNNFSYSAWVRATTTHEVDVQTNSDTAGTGGQTYVFGASHGGDTAAMAGLSVGTNGISVYEHGSSYMPAIAVYNASIGTGWNHIVVTYSNRTPSIWLNGQLVHTGLTSARTTVYAPAEVGAGSYGAFNGGIDEPAVWSRTLPESEIYEMYRTGRGITATAQTFTHTLAKACDACPAGRQYYGIPSNVTRLKVELWGAQGGGAGGNGAYTRGWLNVGSSTYYEFDVAGRGGAPGSGTGYGAGGWPYGGAGGQTTWNGSIGVVGGGGGGRTQFFLGGGTTVIGIAGGGGGQGSGGSYGGVGGHGGANGNNGGYGTSPTSGATPGYGASQSGGGGRGYNDTSFLCCSWYDPTAGGVNTGGAGGGGRDQNGYNPGSGGGGGAGLYGGGGGGGDKEYGSGSGGAGGSSAMNGSYFTSVVFSTGARAGDGLVRITPY